MATLKLRPWPFKKDEAVELYWLCSPYLNARRRWRIKAAFLSENGHLSIEEFPWGSLPYLRFGQKYIDGRPSELFRRGIPGKVTIPDASIGKICSGFDMPPNLYYLYKNNNLGWEKMWKFSVEGRDYYIPCLELASAFFASNKTLTNALLQPYGLNSLIDSTITNGSRLIIELSKRLPRSILTSSLLFQLAWLSQDVSAKVSWDSVYNNLLQKAISIDSVQPFRAFSRSLPIEVKPPVSGATAWTYRGIEKGNSVLILELLEISGVNMPFAEIEYSHPSLKSSVSMKTPKKLGGVKGIKAENTYDLDITEKTVKEDTDQNVLQVEVTLLSFSRIPLLKKRVMSRQNTASGGGLYIDSGPGGVMQPAISEASLDDPIFGGECTPVEFGRSIVLSQLTDAGFQDFCLAVAYLLDIFQDAKISLNIVVLPEGKKFSLCLNDQKRTCAVLLIERPHRQSCCILEILRPDGWSVSTLLVKVRSQVSRLQFEYFINTLIVKLFNGGGHWAENIQDQNFLIERLKHIEAQEPQKWGQRIVNKLC